MTKQHFIALAAEIKRKYGLDDGWETRCVETQQAALDTIAIIVQVAMQFNPKFDETRFRRACGVPV